MIKVRMGRREGVESLRPLTEKDIQKKLYGAYAESTEVEESPSQPKWPESRSQNKGKKFSWPQWKISLPPLPWRKILSWAWLPLRSVLNFSVLLLGKVPARWGVGFFSIVVLFLGIHALNAYRTAAMKGPVQPQPVREVQPVVSEAQEEPRPEPKGPAKASGTSPRIAKSTPANKSVSPQTVNVAKKPYVVQVATYANSSDAGRLVDQLKESHFSSFVQPFNRPNGKTFYLVCLGRFETYREAEAKYREFHQKSIARNFKDSFIRML